MFSTCFKYLHCLVSELYLLQEGRFWPYDKKKISEIQFFSVSAVDFMNNYIIEGIKTKKISLKRNLEEVGWVFKKSFRISLLNYKVRRRFGTFIEKNIFRSLIIFTKVRPNGLKFCLIPYLCIRNLKKWFQNATSWF